MATDSLCPPKLSADPWGRLVLTTPEGRVHVGVDPVRAFPISEPERFISFCDEEGQERFNLAAIDQLAEADARLLRAELANREFVPVIEKIEGVSCEGTPSDWDVVTDRGASRFTLETDDDVRRIGPHRVLITDTRKLRYQVRDVRALDSRSRRLLERYL